MKKYIKAVKFGFLAWLIPFIASFPFVDREGNFIIDEIHFKTVMVVVGALSGVILAVLYFKKVEKSYLKEGIFLGMTWLIVNWALDLLMMAFGFFPLTLLEYFAEIGFRYLSMPIYTIGMGKILESKKS